MSSDEIDKAVATTDLMIWGVMFSILVVVAIGLAIYNRVYENKKDPK